VQPRASAALSAPSPTWNCQDPSTPEEAKPRFEQRCPPPTPDKRVPYARHCRPPGVPSRLQPFTRKDLVCSPKVSKGNLKLGCKPPSPLTMHPKPRVQRRGPKAPACTAVQSLVGRFTLETGGAKLMSRPQSGPVPPSQPPSHVPYVHRQPPKGTQVVVAPMRPGSAARMRSGVPWSSNMMPAFPGPAPDTRSPTAVETEVHSTPVAPKVAAAPPLGHFPSKEEMPSEDSPVCALDRLSSSAEQTPLERRPSTHTLHCRRDASELSPSEGSPAYALLRVPSCHPSCPSSAEQTPFTVARPSPSTHETPSEGPLSFGMSSTPGSVSGHSSDTSQRSPFPSQYQRDYREIKLLGIGSFGRVMKVEHRLDGQIYAVKKTDKPIKGKRDALLRLREAKSLALCSGCPNVLQYHACWIEDDRMYLQTEYCNGGSVTSLGSLWGTSSESKLLELLLQCAQGLHHVHSRGLAHMDIKTENIYVSTVAADAAGTPVYKIGDFGLAVPLSGRDARPSQSACSLHSLRSTCSLDSLVSVFSVMEGDARYLPLDMLNEKKYLREADIFSLGATLYELASGKALPVSGEAWQRLRKAPLDPLPLSDAFCQLLQCMMAQDPLERPTALHILLHPLIRRHQAEKLEEIHRRQQLLLQSRGRPLFDSWDPVRSPLEMDTP